MRRNGILMHISSLPSKYGIGTLGKAAYDFANYLERSGQSLWQILPLNPTGFGDSPYSAYSTFAGNPYFIDLDLLAQEHLLEESEYKDLDWGTNPEQVDYAKMYNNRFPVLRKAAQRFLAHPAEDYETFKNNAAYWLNNYALFMALKKLHAGKSWVDWKQPYRCFSWEKAGQWSWENQEEVEFWKVVQYFFFKQWHALQKYVNDKGIKIVGDVPFYMAVDSADVWSNPHLFLMDHQGNLTLVSGCPPENYHDHKDNGQVWGNPLYNWDAHKAQNYNWWVDRIAHAACLYDIIRLDHFMGFDAFYAVPYGSVNARNGYWMKGPGMDLFHVLKSRIHVPEIIVEDLGKMTPSVKQLLKETGYAGMKVMEFAFHNRDSKGPYLPCNYESHCVAYTGTHDNDTIQGWLENSRPEDIEYAKQYMRTFSQNREVIHWDMIRTLLSSQAETTILQAQDLKALGKWARMNQPSTVGSNWAWRIREDALDAENINWVRNIVANSGRLPAWQQA